MKTKLFLSLVTAALFSIASTNAQVRPRVKNQHHRIAQGVKSGELTKAETKNLVKDQRDFHEDKKAAKADGLVTKSERKELRQEKRQDSRKIYRKKHNERERN